MYTKRTPKVLCRAVSTLALNFPRANELLLLSWHKSAPGKAVKDAPSCRTLQQTLYIGYGIDEWYGVLVSGLSSLTQVTRS